jgi:hypothetical protein
LEKTPGDAGEKLASRLRFPLPPLGDDVVDIDDVLTLSGDDGIPPPIVVVVGIRKVAEGSYFFRVTGGFRDAPLLIGVDDEVGMLFSPFSSTIVGGVFGRVFDLAFPSDSDFATTGVETTGD